MVIFGQRFKSLRRICAVAGGLFVALLVMPLLAFADVGEAKPAMLTDFSCPSAMAENNALADNTVEINKGDGEDSPEYSQEILRGSGGSAYGDTLAIVLDFASVEGEPQVPEHLFHLAAARASDAPALSTPTPSAAATATKEAAQGELTDDGTAIFSSNTAEEDGTVPTQSPSASVSPTNGGVGEIETIPDEELPVGVSANQQINWILVILILIIMGASLGFSVRLWQRRNERFMRRY